MKTFKEIREAKTQRVVLDFDVGDPREFSPDWEEEGVYLYNWNKRKNEMTVEGQPKDLYKWLHTTFGLSKGEAKETMRKAKWLNLNN